MAVTAERINYQAEEFDWEFAEAQFAQDRHADSQAASHDRPAECEIYGRSLSTIHRLGAFAVGKSHSKIIRSPEAAQAKAEFYTSVEEGFGTDIELGRRLEVRKFDDEPRPVINGQVVAEDLMTPISYMTEKGLECAAKTAEKDRRFQPQLVRSKWDHENAQIVDAMARGETDYNTRIVVSPYPEEAASESGDAYWRRVGYVPHLRRGFVQFYYAGEEGLVSGSLSFDGSNKNRLRELFSKYGVQIPKNEVTDNWLQYAITANLPKDAAKELALEIANQAGDPECQKTTNTVEVTDDHRVIMDTVFSESYVHACESFARGYQTLATRELVFQLANEADSFNAQYKDALYKMRANQKQFTSDDMIVLHELLVYSTIEMMRTLHLQTMEHGAESDLYSADYLDAAYLQSLTTASFQRILSSFGAEGARNNHVYSACGLEIAPGGDESNPDKNPQYAFGGAANSESSSKKWMNCPYCPAKVFDDPCAKILCCPDCKAKVVNGRVVSKGDGGHKARAAKRAAEKQKAELAKQVDAAYEEKGITAEVFEQKADAASAA